MSIDDLRMWYVESIIQARGDLFYINDIRWDEDEDDVVIEGRKIKDDGSLSSRSTCLDETELTFFSPKPSYALGREGEFIFMQQRKRNTYCRGFRPNHWTAIGFDRALAWLKGLTPETDSDNWTRKGIVLIRGNQYRFFGGKAMQEDELTPFLKSLVDEVKNAS